VSFSGALVLALFGSQAIGLLYGPEYMPDQMLMVLLSACSAIRLIRSLPNTWLMSLERTEVLLFSNLPRLFALAAAVAWIQRGAGLVTLAGFSLVSEAVSLVYVLIVCYSQKKILPAKPQEI
jgi:O-antigen/teichoic acid export membrane protein